MKNCSSSKSSKSREAEYRLILFIAGEEPNSRAARENLAAFCSSRLKDRWEVEIVDVLAEYERAAEESILVTPTLVIRHVETTQILIGTLSDRKILQRVLGLKGSLHDRE
jgi:circadian clock protein KaiB